MSRFVIHPIVAVVAAALGLSLAAPAGAHWAPDNDDPQLATNHKMHYPQMPDPSGWDVDITRGFVADDFQCSQTGPIEDVHFWASWQGDNDGGIEGIWAQIWSDMPAGEDPNPDVTWSHPDQKLWEDTFWAEDGNFAVQPYGEPASQGYYNPHPDAYYHLDDHMNTIQVNIDTIANPFPQEEETIYWLALHVIPETPQTYCGWKTSPDAWNDDATWELALDWHELLDPETGTSLDMAFVITPEPASLALFGLGGLVLLRRRR